MCDGVRYENDKNKVKIKIENCRQMRDLYWKFCGGLCTADLPGLAGCGCFCSKYDRYNQHVTLADTIWNVHAVSGIPALSRLEAGKAMISV